jgi:hypothetical protein
MRDACRQQPGASHAPSVTVIVSYTGERQMSTGSQRTEVCDLNDREAVSYQQQDVGRLEVAVPHRRRATKYFDATRELPHHVPDLSRRHLACQSESHLHRSTRAPGTRPGCS